MHVLLIHPPIREDALPCNLPLGLAYVAAELKRDGIRYSVFDANVERLSGSWLDKLAARVRWGQFTHIGISAITHQYRYVETIVSLVRAQLPDVPIIVGGPISVLGTRLAEWLKVFVYHGEAEGGFPDYLRKELYRSGPVFNAPALPDLVGLSHPDWASFNMRAYLANPVGAINVNKWRGGHADNAVSLSANLLASRGCPYSCSYCAHDSLGIKYRKRPVDEVLAEVKVLRNRYGAGYVHLSDDNTTVDKRWLIELCAGMLSLGVQWGCAGRVDSVDHDLLELMLKTGCLVVGYGVESGSQKMLDGYEKGQTVEEIEAALIATKAVFGKADYSLMLGGVGESDLTVQETIDLCRRTGTSPAVVFYTTPLPGTALYDYARKTGLIVDELAYVRGLGEHGAKIHCNVSGQTNEWLIAAKKRLEGI